jgi:O-methyltransferase
MQKLLALLIVLAMVAVCLYSSDVAQMLGVSLPATRLVLGIATVIVIVAVPLLIPNPLLARLEKEGNRAPVAETEYARLGLGPVPISETSRECYLDLLQRALTNVLYEDLSLMGYDKSRTARLTEGFDLERRKLGEDVPWQAHTMVGWQRLGNVRYCVETAIRENVPGDFVELGVLRGGASIMMRGVMRADGDTERKVYACDTFVPRPELSTFTRRFLLPVVSIFASIPIRPWQRWICKGFIRTSGSFPIVEDPSDELIGMTLFTLQNVNLMSYHRGTGLADVKSNFARYGLLDDQVVFLQGYFSDTLSKAPIENLALMRLDGDTFESTRDVLKLLYSRLSPGGFCIIDDYHAFTDCQKAVDHFRQEQGIGDELIPIDNHGVYWRKQNW